MILFGYTRGEMGRRCADEAMDRDDYERIAAAQDHYRATHEIEDDADPYEPPMARSKGRMM